MDFDEFRSILGDSGVDVWTLIETAISVASSDYEGEFRRRRGGIVERLFAPMVSRCGNCDHHRDLLRDHDEEQRTGDEALKENAKHQSGQKPRVEKASIDPKRGSPLNPDSVEEMDRDMNREHGIDDFDEEQRKILAIKEHLHDPDQSEDTLVDLLQSLADMDITFNALKETDIGRHVNRLRKHSSNEVKGLVKQLVRKWKDLVDDWVRLNTPPGESTPNGMDAERESPQQTHHKLTQDGHHQVPDFAYSPNPHYGNSVSDKNTWDPEAKAKAVHRREPQTKPFQPNSHSPLLASNKQREQKQCLMDPGKFDSARKRLQQNYQEAQMAKKQRTIQVMNIHEIPKPKNAFFAKNRGSSIQAKHW